MDLKWHHGRYPPCDDRDVLVWTGDGYRVGSYDSYLPFKYADHSGREIRCVAWAELEPFNLDWIWIGHEI